MPQTIKVPHVERGEFAAWLFATVDENDWDRKSDVKSANGGYEISDRLWDALHPSVSHDEVEKQIRLENEAHNDALRAEGVETTGGTWLEPGDLDEKVAYAEAQADALAIVLSVPDFKEGAPASANVDRETIRIWAKENGIPVADRGQLKKAVIEAYDSAHSTK